MVQTKGKDTSMDDPSGHPPGDPTDDYEPPTHLAMETIIPI